MTTTDACGVTTVTDAPGTYSYACELQCEPGYWVKNRIDVMKHECAKCNTHCETCEGFADSCLTCPTYREVKNIINGNKKP